MLTTNHKTKEEIKRETQRMCGEVQKGVHQMTSVKILLKTALKDMELTTTSTSYDQVIRKNMEHVLESIISAYLYAAVYTPPPNKTDANRMVLLNADFLLKCAEVFMEGCVLDFETPAETHSQMNRTIDPVRDKLIYC